MATVAQEHAATAGLSRRQDGMLTWETVVKIALSTFLAAFFVGLFGFLGWLGLQVSDLKRGLERVEAVQAAQAKTLEELRAGQASNRELIASTRELLVALAAAQGVRVPRTDGSP